MVESSPELQGFVLQNITRTGVHLGTGSYGEVEELCWNGTKCAGKCLHDTLLDQRPSTSNIVASKFVSECRLIAKIRHPNVVQFLGLCFFPDYRNQQRLYLVMEKLNDNLSNLLESKPNIQLSVKCSILLDVSRGLVHLHSNETPIVHRDLTSRNILLTASMQAKIADLGTARMINMAGRMQHTPTPGTPLFMPPEANTATPKYDTKLDIFSFGQVMLHTLTQVFPYELLPPTYETSSGKIRGRSEVERREEYMELLHSQLKKDHQLSRLTASCFENAPRRRPTAKEVMTILEEFHLELENAGLKYNAFSKITGSIQDKHDSPAKVEGQSALLNEEGGWNFEMRKRSATFMESHILKGHPGVLKIYQSGGMFRRNMEWKEFVFKIAERKLQYYNLNNRLQSELPLAKVECAKAFWSPNSMLFPFHIHFKGRGTPWILGAHSNEERQSWMEAIKPGSTLNQWVRSNFARPRVMHTPSIPSEATPNKSPPPIPPRTKHPAPPEVVIAGEDAQDARTTTDSHGLTAPEIPPRPDLLSSLSGTYIPAHLLNTVIPCKEDERSMATRKDDGEDVPKKEGEESYYLPIVSSMSGGQDDDIVRELGKQFNPVQVDLLVQMFKTWLDPQQQQQQQNSSETTLPKSRKISLPEKSLLSVDSSPNDPTALHPLTRRHVGYANEGRTSPYHCLAGIAKDLQDEKDFDRGETRRQAEIKRQGIYFSLADLFDKDKPETVPGEFHTLEECPEELSVEEAYERATCSLSQLQRRNAMRVSVGKLPRSASEGQDSLSQQRGKEERVSEPEKPVNTLKSVLKQASRDEMLDDENSEYPGWSKANTKAIGASKVPMTNRMSTYCDVTEYDIFLSREDFIDFQQIEEGQFGPVYRASRQMEYVCPPVALKPIKVPLTSGAEVGNFLREMAILRCIRHPNIAQVFGVVNEANWIVMEYLPNGDLKNYLIYNKHTVSSLLRYMLDISMGMHYLSAKGFVHRKLAARNILVSENETCKVADLDLGSQDYWMDSTPTGEGGTSTPTEEGVRDPYNTLRWMAPEILLSRHFSTASDVWSFGVVMWEMFNPSSLPYEECDDKVCVERITQGYALEVPRECPERVAKILRACWYQNPASRPSFLYMSSLLSSIILEFPYKTEE